MHSWTLDDMPDLSGSTAVVTGANSGIGAVTALVLARSGARTVLACRDPERGRPRRGRRPPSRPRLGRPARPPRSGRSEQCGRGRGGHREGGRRAPRPPGEQRRGDGPAATPYGGRFRDAVRHQPPGPLRADQPAAARPRGPGSGARGDALLDRPPDRPYRPRGPQRRAGVQQVAGLRPVQARQPAVHGRAGPAGPRRRPGHGGAGGPSRPLRYGVGAGRAASVRPELGREAGARLASVHPAGDRRGLCPCCTRRRCPVPRAAPTTAPPAWARPGEPRRPPGSRGAPRTRSWHGRCGTSRPG